MKRIACLGTAWLVAGAWLRTAVGESRGQGGGTGFEWAKFKGQDGKEYEEPRFIVQPMNQVSMTSAIGFYSLPQGQGIIAEETRYWVFKEVAPNVWPAT